MDPLTLLLIQHFMSKINGNGINPMGGATFQEGDGHNGFAPGIGTASPIPMGIGGGGANLWPIGVAAGFRSVSPIYGTPSASYQGYLSSLQERRDARAGVPGVPPQGAASPSAQRKSQPGSSSRGRSY